MWGDSRVPRSRRSGRLRHDDRGSPIRAIAPWRVVWARGSLAPSLPMVGGIVGTWLLDGSETSYGTESRRNDFYSKKNRSDTSTRLLSPGFYYTL